MRNSILPAILLAACTQSAPTQPNPTQCRTYDAEADALAAVDAEEPDANLPAPDSPCDGAFRVAINCDGRQMGLLMAVDGPTRRPYLSYQSWAPLMAQFTETSDTSCITRLHVAMPGSPGLLSVGWSSDNLILTPLEPLHVLTEAGEVTCNVGVTRDR